MNGSEDSISQPKVRQSKEGRDGTVDERGAQLHVGQQPTSCDRTIRYFSMFTGVGGFEIGFQRANDSGELLSGKGSENIQGGSSDPEERQARFACVGVAEIDKYSSAVLAHRFPGVRNWGDVTKIDPAELPDFDMLCGGFPCQAFSIAGNRKGFEDTRGTMFFEVARIIKVKRPKLVFLENVKGLLNHDKGKTFGVIIQTLEELGYDVQWMVLNSKFHGVPQNRERVFIIASLRGESRPEILPFTGDYPEAPIQKQGNQRGILLSAETGGREVNISNCLDTMYCKGLGSKQERIAVAVLTPDRPEKRQNGRRFKEDGEESFTLTGQDIHGVMTVANCVTPDAYLQTGVRERIDGKAVLTSAYKRRIRRLTPTECERLQGFPDGWTEFGVIKLGREKMSDTQRYKMMGNAVTTNVITAIARQLIKWEGFQ